MITQTANALVHRSFSRLSTFHLSQIHHNSYGPVRSLKAEKRVGHRVDTRILCWCVRVWDVCVCVCVQGKPRGKLLEG